ncbi:GerMN domain-containing protein [Salinispira pacifica]
MANNKKKRKASFGVLFWIAVILLFLVVFVATKPRIQEVVQSTGLMDVLQHRFGKDGASPQVETRNVVIGTDKNAPSGGGSQADGSATNTDKQSSGAPAPATDQPKFRKVPGLSGGGQGNDAGTSGNAGTSGDGREPAPSASGKPVSAPASPAPSGNSSSGGAASAPEKPGPRYHVRTAKLYYTFVTDDGRILPEAVDREVRYIDSPLTDTIRALLKGPTPEELNKGVLNLIPPKTQLLSAYVQNGIAYLNFNEAFEFNTMGVEGFIAQLKEIVHTATEFSTVSRVQFLVNGKKVDYLGGEGIYIGRPLGRDSFS